MPKLGNTLICMKSRRIPFSARLERQLAASWIAPTWRSAALVALATTVFWLAA